jgi:predicted dehydrogenase
MAVLVRRIRWGMAGGGRGAFIGGAHRMAARLDGDYELAACALSRDPENARTSAAELGIAADRAYADYREMARAEAARADGIEAVTIVTPNHTHVPIARAFLDAGIHVICDKPLATSSADAAMLAELAAKKGKLLGVTFNYTGYPLIREARAMVADGALGAVRVVQAEFALGWLSTDLENQGVAQAAWRVDPERSGPSGVIADLGTHTMHLAGFVTGLKLERVAADLSTFVEGRRLEDNASVLLRYGGGARGALWASAVAAGEKVGLRLRVFGETGHLAWDQSHPDQLQHRPLEGHARIIERGAAESPFAKQSTRLVSGLPEGYLEAFANLYRAYAEAIRRGGALDPSIPQGRDGVETLEFVEAVLRSHEKGGAWEDVSAR